MAEEHPILNSYTPSWCDISTVINVAGGGTFKDIGYKELSYKSALSYGTQEGASGGIIISQTQGREKPEASAVYYAGALRRFISEALVPAARSAGYVRGNQVRIGLVRFDIIIFHSPIGITDIFQDKLMGCRVASIEAKEAEGDDAITRPIDLAPMQIVQVMPDGTEVVLV